MTEIEIEKLKADIAEFKESEKARKAMVEAIMVKSDFPPLKRTYTYHKDNKFRPAVRLVRGK